MTSSKKFLAVAIVAMFIASGLIVVAGSDSYAEDDKNVVMANPDGTIHEGIYFTGEWALQSAMNQLKENPSFQGCHLKVIQDFSGQPVKIKKVSEGNYVVNHKDGDLSIPSSVEIDFGGFTYTVASAEEQGFYVDDGFQLTLRNGTIDTLDNVTSTLIKSNAKTLTINKLVLDGSNLKQSADQSSYTLSVTKGAVTMTDSGIIASKQSTGDSIAYALEVGGNAGLITLNDDITIDGSIEFAETGLPSVYISGTTSIISGSIEKTTGSEPMVMLEDESAILFSEGVRISELIVSNTFRFTNIVAGAGGIAVLNGKIAASVDGLTLLGNLTTDGKGDVLIVHKSTQETVTFGIGAIIGKGVTAQFNQDKAIIMGLLKISDGASWKIDSYVHGSDDESFIVVEKGATYNGSAVTKNNSFRVDPDGTVHKVFLIIFEVTSNVKSITYEGKSYYYSEDGEGVVIDLSKVKVSLDSGYVLKGFMVGDTKCKVDQKVTVGITGTTISAIVESADPEPSDPSGGSDSTTAIICAVLVVLVALVGAVFVFSRER